jgi:hypothetical protein
MKEAKINSNKIENLQNFIIFEALSQVLVMKSVTKLVQQDSTITPQASRFEVLLRTVYFNRPSLVCPKAVTFQPVAATVRMVCACIA